MQKKDLKIDSMQVSTCEMQFISSVAETDADAVRQMRQTDRQTDVQTDRQTDRAASPMKLVLSHFPLLVLAQRRTLLLEPTSAHWS